MFYRVGRKSPLKLLYLFGHLSPLLHKLKIHRTSGSIGDKQRTLAFRGLV